MVERRCIQSPHRCCKAKSSQQHNCINELATASKTDKFADNLRSARLDISPVLHVDFIHSRKVVHVGKKDVHLNDILNRGACRL
jgi:hypothetical protein